jgi:putative endonuclease
MLRCNDGSLYTGWTNNIEKRLSDHKAGKGSKCVRGRLPVTLVHLEEFATKEEAMKREYEIKKKMTKLEKEKLVESKTV